MYQHLAANSPKQSRSPIPARVGLGARFIFLRWQLLASWRAGEYGRGCPCLYLPPSLCVVEAQAGPLVRTQAISAFLRSCRGKFPDHLPYLALGFQHVSLALPSSLRNHNNNNNNSNPGGHFIPDSSEELLVSTRNRHTMVTSNVNLSLSLPQFTLSLA